MSVITDTVRKCASEGNITRDYEYSFSFLTLFSVAEGLQHVSNDWYTCVRMCSQERQFLTHQVVIAVEPLTGNIVRISLQCYQISLRFKL